MTRLAIAGGSGTGKTTLAVKTGIFHGVIPLHTDDLIGRVSQEDMSAAVARWFEASGPLIVEGVVVPRGLRKWLEWHTAGKPVDRVIWLPHPLRDRKAGQVTQAKGVETVWQQVRNELAARGVVIDVVEVRT